MFCKFNTNFSKQQILKLIYSFLLLPTLNPTLRAELNKRRFNFANRFVVDKINVLKHGEGAHLGCNSCKDAHHMFSVVAYQHELVVKLGINCFYALAS